VQVGDSAHRVNGAARISHRLKKFVEDDNEF